MPMPAISEELRGVLAEQIKVQMVENYRDTVEAYEGDNHPYDKFFEHYMVDVIRRSDFFETDDDIEISESRMNTVAADFDDIPIDGLVVGGARDIKIDGWVRSENKLVLIQAKFHADETFVEPRTGAIDELILAKHLLMMNPLCGNQKRQELGRWYQENSENIEVIIVAGVWGKVLGYTSGCQDADASQLIETHNIIVYDFEEIIQEYNQQTNPQTYTQPTEKGLTGKFLPTKKNDESIIEMIGYMTLESLATFFTKGDDENDRDLGLLEPNVRMKIADTNSRAAEIETDIKSTLTESADDFFALNNGIVIVCTGIVKGNDDQYTLIEPGIVNGGQSIQAIWEKRNEFSGDGFSVVKVVAADDERTVKISEAANSQNEVTKRDLKSRQSEQIERKNNWFCTVPGDGERKVYYEIRRGQWENESENDINHQEFIQGSTQRKITNELAAQIFWAFNGGMNYPKAKKKEMWSNNNLYNYLHKFEIDTTYDDVQQYFVNNFNVHVDRTERGYVRDVLAGNFLLNMLKQISSKLSDARSIFSEDGENDEEQLVEFDNHNKIFKGSTWDYTGLSVLNYIIKKRIDMENLGNLDAKIQRRGEIIEHLIGGQISDVNTVGRCFRKRFPNWFNVDQNSGRFTILDVDNPHNVDNENVPNNFSDLARWVSSIEIIIREAWVATSQNSEEEIETRDVLHGGSVAPFVTQIRQKVDAIFNRAVPQINLSFPITTDEEVNQTTPEEVISDVRQTWDSFFTNRAPPRVMRQQAPNLLARLQGIDIEEANSLTNEINVWLSEIE